MDFHSKMAKDGRILIPAKCRAKLQIKPGENLIIRVKNGECYIISLNQAVKQAQAVMRRYKKPRQHIVEEFLEERRKEADNE